MRYNDTKELAMNETNDKFKKIQDFNQKNRTDIKKKKKRIFDILQIGKKEDLPSRLFDWLITIVIIVNITVLFLYTFDYFDPYRSIISIVENITLMVFLAEYILRIWTAEYLYPDLPPAKARLRFLFSFDGIVDLFTILPVFFLSGFAVLRMLRVVRILHLFRINANYDSFNVITNVLWEKKNQLLSSLFIIIILMMASSLCMYNVEHAFQPEVFDNAFAGIWWSLSTIFTVGYGDIYPITYTGRFLAIIITILGVCVVAIPTGIISAGFVEQYTRMQRSLNEDPNSRTIASIAIDENCSFTGWTVRQVEEAYMINIATIVRDGNVMLPSGDTRIQLDDTVLYQTTTLI